MYMYVKCMLVPNKGRQSTQAEKLPLLSLSSWATWHVFIHVCMSVSVYFCSSMCAMYLKRSLQDSHDLNFMINMKDQIHKYVANCKAQKDGNLIFSCCFFFGGGEVGGWGAVYRAIPERALTNRFLANQGNITI